MVWVTKPEGLQEGAPLFAKTFVPCLNQVTRYGFRSKRVIDYLPISRYQAQPAMK